MNEDCSANLIKSDVIAGIFCFIPYLYVMKLITGFTN